MYHARYHTCMYSYPVPKHPTNYVTLVPKANTEVTKVRIIHNGISSPLLKINIVEPSIISILSDSNTSNTYNFIQTHNYMPTPASPS